TLINRAVITDFGGLANDDTQPVVNEKAPADLCPGMDFDTGQPAGKMRNETTQPVRIVLPTPMRNTMPPQGMQARIGKYDLRHAARRRVTVENGLNIFANTFKHAAAGSCLL